MKHQDKCIGVILVNPIGSSAGFFEAMADKVCNSQKLCLMTNSFDSKIVLFEVKQLETHETRHECKG